MSERHQTQVRDARSVVDGSVRQNADTECDPTLLDDFARDLEGGHDSEGFFTMVYDSSPVSGRRIAVPRPRTFFSEQLIPSVKILTSSQCCQKGFPRSLRAWRRWDIRQKLLSQSSRHQCRCSVPVPASTWVLYHWTLSMSRISFRGGLA